MSSTHEGRTVRSGIAAEFQHSYLPTHVGRAHFLNLTNARQPVVLDPSGIFPRVWVPHWIDRAHWRWVCKNTRPWARLPHELQTMIEGWFVQQVNRCGRCQQPVKTSDWSDWWCSDACRLK